MVSSLHASVLGTTVPSVGSVSSVASSTSSSSVSSSSTTSASFDSVSFSSTGRMMAAEGSHPPDFDAMSTDEFRDHLVELQEKMAADGIDTSNMVDPSTLSDDDLNALKDEMSAMGSRGPQGKQGPPPPPPSTSVEEDTDEMLQTLLDAMEEDSDSTAQLISSLLS